jgi:hypothetical protein
LALDDQVVAPPPGPSGGVSATLDEAMEAFRAMRRSRDHYGQKIEPARDELHFAFLRCRQRLAGEADTALAVTAGLNCSVALPQEITQ